jgi:SAM-dependent methyltransferase
VPPEGYRFPFDAETFDFVFATSVYTHMLPDSVARYISEAARVLKPGGTFFGTFFLHNALTDALESQGRSHAQFPYRPDAPFRAANPHVPENAVAYAEAHVLDLVGRALNDAAPQVHPGAWSGRPDFVSYQDIVIARKDRSTEG